MLRTIRNINQKIVKEKNIQELIEFSANSLTEARGYNNAWIVLHDKDRNITHAAQSGLDNDFEKVLRLIKTDEGLNCYRHSLEDKKAYIINQPLMECKDCPIAGNYIEQKAITIPLISNNTNFGVLTVSVGEEFSNPEELSLLEEVVGDIAYCVYNNELEAKQKASLKELKESETRYRLLFDNLLVGIYKSGGNGEMIDCNDAFAHLLGYTYREDILKLKADDLYYNKGGRKDFLVQMENTKQEAVVEILLKNKNGKPIWLLESVKKIDGNTFQGTVIDITEKKRAEERQEKLLNTLTERVKEMSCLNSINDICQKNTLTVYEILQRTVEALPFGFQNSGITSARIRLQEFEVSTDNCKETKWFLQEFFHYTSGHRGIIEVFYTEEKPFREIGPFISEEQNLLKNVALILSETIQRRNAEVSLKESEEIFLAITKAAQDGIVMIDEKGKVIYFNTAAEKMFGYAAKELIGLPIHEFIAPDRYAKPYTEGMENFQKTGDGPIIDKVREMMAKKKDGSEFPVELSVSGILMKGAWHAVGMVRDITVRKQAEKALVDSEDRFRGMFENSTIGMYQTTPRGEILLANPALLNMLGYESFQELLKLGTVEKGYVRNENREVFQKIIKNEDVIYGYESEWKKKDGTVRLFRESARTVRDEKNEIIYYEGVVEDITDAKMVELALVEAKERAEESSRIKTSILNNMSHELRTPLVGILGFAETLKNEITDVEHKDMAGRIFNSGKRLSNTLNSILNLSIIESGNITVAISHINPLQIVEKVISVHAESAEEKHLYLKTLNNNDTPVKLDKDLFEQVLGFLVDNGIKYTENGGITIEIGDEDYEGKMFKVIKVIDTGCGILKENQKQIFEQFRQVSEGHSRSSQGLGLGLSIAYKYVHLMNGELSVESTFGEGSTFIMRFPLINEDSLIEEMNEEATLEKLPIAEGKINTQKIKPKILLVEDDDTNIVVAKLFLKKIYDVDAAMNGDSALEMVNLNKYDAILMDINLGKGKNGAEVTREIREISGYEKIPIVAVTAYAMGGDKEEFIRAGCSHYLPKPFAQKNLLGLLGEALRVNE